MIALLLCPELPQRLHTPLRQHQRLGGGIAADEITTEYPSLTPAGVRAAAAYCAALAREELLPMPRHSALGKPG